ncbi:alpha/beta hydrolase [Novosphingobium resinovorum]|uniref:alpha/beta hydrolase n=1 Tax=Novosphingobium resinovorum TaxID=158500 RepID=UPI002ED6BF36|nr:alpha/beta hydrolase [Novosphingobium resinovorum]
MRSLSVCLACVALFAVSPLSAQVIDYEAVDEVSDPVVTGGERTLFTTAVVEAPAIAQGPAYGPFRVIDEGRAALVDVTDGRTPALFAAMLRDHPGIATIEMIDCPGTEDDLANLKVGQMIRQRGLVTHVPAGGSVRSGGVELFLAGARRYADPGSEFAVHSWQDDTGLEPSDYAANAPENRRYIDYYRAMGMSTGEAQAFYAMTNSVPFASARWLDEREMGAWVQLDDVKVDVTPRFQFVQLAALVDSIPSFQ